MQLGVQLGQLIRLVVAGLRDIADSSSFHDVTDNKFLDRLVLGDTARTVGAAYRVHMATAVLGASTVSAFASLQIVHTQS